jgi:hypothetical protein
MVTGTGGGVGAGTVVGGVDATDVARAIVLDA